MRKSTLLAAVAIGCSGSGNNGGGTTGGAGGLALADFTTTLQSALCAKLSACSGGIAAYVCASGGLATGFPDFNAAVTSGRVKYDGTQAQACVASLMAATCGSLRGNGGALPASCKMTFQGTVAAGGACYDSIDCASGTCDTSNMACPSMCKAYLATGADCTHGGDCNSDNGESCVNGMCGAPGDLGAACQSGDDCKSRSCQSMKCAAPAGSGAACTSGSGCSSGLYCFPDPSSSTGMGMCQAQVAANGTCAEDSAHAFVAFAECATGLVCAGYSYSFSSSTGTPGSCKPPADEGGACTAIPQGSVGGTGCAFGLACLSAKCAKPPASGPCANDAFAKCQYQVAYCDSSTMTCVPPKADGQPCSASAFDECASGACNGANGSNMGRCGASPGHCAEK